MKKPIDVVIAEAGMVVLGSVVVLAVCALLFGLAGTACCDIFGTLAGMNRKWSIISYGVLSAVVFVFFSWCSFVVRESK